MRAADDEPEGDEGDDGDSVETQTVSLPQPDTATSLGSPWQVIVWDDPINLMNYVSYVFQRLFGFSATEAEARMLEVHNEGRSVVASEPREKAEYFVTQLHAYGLQATMEQAGD